MYVTWWINCIQFQLQRNRFLRRNFHRNKSFRCRNFVRYVYFVRNIHCFIYLHIHWHQNIFIHRFCYGNHLLVTLRIFFSLRQYYLCVRRESIDKIGHSAIECGGMAFVYRQKKMKIDSIILWIFSIFFHLCFKLRSILICYCACFSIGQSFPYQVPIFRFNCD